MEKMHVPFVRTNILIHIWHTSHSLAHSLQSLTHLHKPLAKVQVHTCSASHSICHYLTRYCILLENYRRVYNWYRSSKRFQPLLATDFARHENQTDTSDQRNRNSRSEHPKDFPDNITLVYIRVHTTASTIAHSRSATESRATRIHDRDLFWTSLCTLKAKMR